MINLANMRNSFIYLLLTISVTKQDNSILCSNQYCETYRRSTDCPDIPLACKIQNSTRNGVFLPFPGPCNCCKYCLENIGVGHECVLGSPDSPPPTVICSDRLTCAGKKDDSKCATMKTSCIQAQQYYDERKRKGTLGYMELRPECDRSGNYKWLQCIPGEICFCIDENGERLFGEVPYNPDATYLTQCQCSRSINNVNKVLNVNGYSLMRARCLADGNYDPLQCVGQQERCICVDKMDGSPADSNRAPVPLHVITELPCFDKKLHMSGSYWKPCEKEYNNTLALMKSIEEEGFDGVTGVSYPSCQNDGFYAAIQENDTHKYCANPNGKIIHEFVVDKTSDLADAMNCFCARSLNIITINSKERPKCCKNGNYEPIQCRRGKCRCVNNHGIQNKQEVDIADKDSLKCYDTCRLK